MEQFQTPIIISNHPVYGYTRKVTQYIFKKGSKLELAVTVDSFTEGDVVMPELSVRHLLTAGYQADAQPRKDPATGADVFRYQIQEGAFYEFSGKGQFAVVNGDYVLVDGEKVETAEWATSISEADYFKALPIGTVKTALGLDDTASFLTAGLEGQLSLLILDSDSKKRFDI